MERDVSRLHNVEQGSSEIVGKFCTGTVHAFLDYYVLGQTFRRIAAGWEGEGGLANSAETLGAQAEDGSRPHTIIGMTMLTLYPCLNLQWVPASTSLPPMQQSYFVLGGKGTVYIRL